MIKNREECILRFFCPIKELYIINDKYIYQLIKMYKIVDSIVATMILKLVDELLRTNIQHYFLGMCVSAIVWRAKCAGRNGPA